MSYTCVERASHLLLYIIYFALCDQDLVISFSYNACMQGELTLRLSSWWMYIAYISLLFDLCSPLCWWFDKKGEEFWSFIYTCLCMFISFLVLYKKGEKNFESFIYACLFSCLMHICFVYAKRGEVFEKFIYVYFLIYAYICCLIYAFIEYLYCLLLCMS